MKYEKGDKFIIEIDEVIPYGNDKNIYLIKAGDSALGMLTQQTLDRLEQIQEHDGCDGCEYFPKAASDYPCYDCKQNYTDMWTPKTDEIQVGDEVEHEDGRKGVVVKVHEYSVCPLVFSSMNRIAVVLWPKDECTRTGRTYPELIKALEELPKEGE